MKEEVVIYKASEYVGKVGVSVHLGRREKARQQVKTLLVLYRLQSRYTSQRITNARGSLRSVVRGQKKLKSAGITIPLVDDRKKKLQKDLQAAESELALIGEQIFETLDLWESLGATMEDLCNLCNCDLTQVLAKLDTPKMPFSQITCVYNLDYKNPHDKGWLEDEVDAPFTHALKTYLRQNAYLEKGRAAAREAMEAVFPEIMENALTIVTDADGVQRLVDKDGVEIATLDEGD
ncbi:MAG: hypothetical protein ACLSWS_10255 [Faecalispora jeddahensis]